MSSIVLLIIGSFLLMFFEVVMITAGLISIGMIISIEIYNRVDAWKFALIFLIVSLGIDAYFGYFLGTYLFCIVLGVLIHTTLKRTLPYDRLPIRLFVLFVSFLSFHITRNIFIEIQVSSIGNLDWVNMLFRSSLRSIFETGILVSISYILHTYFGKSLTSVKLKV